MGDFPAAPIARHLLPLLLRFVNFALDEISQVFNPKM
jgi:hypothetical protein